MSHCCVTSTYYRKNQTFIYMKISQVNRSRKYNKKVHHNIIISGWLCSKKMQYLPSSWQIGITVQFWLTWRQLLASYASAVVMKIGIILASIWLHCPSLIHIKRYSAAKIFVFHFVICTFSKLQVVIFHFQLARHTGSFCRCVTNTSPDSADNR